MKITVVGASGGIGRHLVRQALADGHDVTAALRSPEKLTDRHPRLTIVRADALDAASVEPAIEGADAVLSGIGQAGRHDPLRPASTSARAVTEAMAATGVRRLLVVSAGPLNHTGAGQPFLAHRVFGPLLWAVLKELYTDLERMEAVLRETDLDWTSVRPPRLLDKPGTGRYRHALEAGPSGSSIPRADVARAMLDFVTDPTTYHHTVGVST
ncbi:MULTISPECIES: NAD(P)H-binding protein [unclassified Streptomyces]|uniref:NAD(P)-dependent oxidoreductase n=1 Tax=unclassified Streptomyces TaxID=2593676 RepID=UPI0003749E34|nr:MULTISPECIES: NAD(P)H-binding protein [unclassified Streptomyces]MYT30335.1 NAD(P)H-binding protein [Streptomyces sp. SID8354]